MDFRVFNCSLSLTRSHSLYSYSEMSPLFAYLVDFLYHSLKQFTDSKYYYISFFSILFRDLLNERNIFFHSIIFSFCDDLMLCYRYFCVCVCVYELMYLQAVQVFPIAISKKEEKKNKRMRKHFLLAFVKKITFHFSK